MSKTFSRKPFISYDGPEEGPDGTIVRAEVKVVTGYGEVFDIKDSKNKKKNPDNYARNALFEVSNTEFNPSGWAQSSDPVMEKVQQAYDNDELIHFRLETRRKKDIDRTTPINELTATSDIARDNIHKSLAAVRFDGDVDENGDEVWTISKNAVTRLDEDPHGGDGIRSAYDYSLEELQSLKKQQSGDGGRDGNTNTQRDWSANVEAPPYVLYLDAVEGKLNLGSAAITVPLSMYMYVTEYERDHDVELTDRQRKSVSRAMVSAANNIQIAIFDGKLQKADMTAGSHVRARSVVFEVIRTVHPISDDIVSSGENLKAWRDNVVATGTELLQWAISEVKLVSR